MSFFRYEYLFLHGMLKNEYKVIGLMSGTSLDGLDLAYIHFKYDGFWRFEILEAETVKYHMEWVIILKNLVNLTTDELVVIDTRYTKLLSESVNEFIRKYAISDLDAVCSHGHTALHDPEYGLTYQIGNQKQLASLINLKVVCDFRVQDVALGGQGAPLVPIGDRLLFSTYDYCLNLGGFANISTDINEERIAYDICPVNIILNPYVSQLGLEYDDQGKIAESGTIHIELLKALNALDFYDLSYPKSLGLEWVKSEVFPIIDSFDLEIKDVLRTCVEHISIQIVKEIDKKKNCEVLISGGGVFNSFLMKRIQEQTQHTLVIPDTQIIEYKEALIFGLLGVLKLRGEINCLRSVTGAKKDHCSGKVYIP